MNITFSETKVHELESLNKIYNYYIENTFVCFHLNKLTINELRDYLIIQDNRFKTFTIYIDDIICGFVQINRFKNRDAYNFTGEISVYLDINFTKMGIGKKALEFIEKYAHTKKFHSLMATISGENIASKKLFESFDYTQCAYLKEVGVKFDKCLDVVIYQKII